MNKKFTTRRIAAALLVLCSGSAMAAGSAVLAISTAPETLDPYNSNMTFTHAVSKTFYEGLFGFDKDLKVKNVLATGYEVSKDGKTYTFKLRPNVKFQDGTPFDSEAVKANFDRVLNPDNHLLRATQFNRIVKVEPVDPLTVRITLKEAFGPFINSLAHGSAVMISPAAIKKYGKDIGLHPVGTGPFKLVEWKQTEAIVGEKFDGYWRTGYPKIDKITWKPVPENSTRSAMLQTGEADFAAPLPYEQAESLKKDSKLEITTAPSIMTRYVVFNMLQKPFDNPKVREAIGYAINKQALVKVAFNGYAIPAQGFVPQGVQNAAKMPTIAYDPNKARQLLKEAGYPNGFESVLWSAYNNSTSQKAIQFIQQQLAQVGIKVSVQALEPGQRAQLVDSWPDPKTAKMRMIYFGWSSSTGEADWALRPLFSTEGWTPKLANYGYYSNTAVDADLARALVTNDLQERTKLYKNVQETLMHDLPRIPLVTEENLSGRNKRLTGVYYMPDANINLDEIAVSK